MRVGVFADPHITKNMRSMQLLWEQSALSSIFHMYDKFDEEDVETVVCLGDFFDKPSIEAKQLNILLPVLKHINERTYPTYMLLGNHEIDSESSNILEYLTEYENIIPVTEMLLLEDRFLFIPYSQDIDAVPHEYIDGKFVFTHHDIYGSALAGGKTKAFFGVDPALLKDAKMVFNGHVHLHSKVSDNIMNAGSLLVSQQGELRVGEYPQYYILDTNSDGSIYDLSTYENTHSMLYLSINVDQAGELVQKGYDQSKLVLRVDYEGEMPDTFIDTAHTSWRKLVTSISGDNTESVSRSTNFDLKNYLVEYIKKDNSIPDSEKEEYIRLGLEVLG